MNAAEQPIQAEIRATILRADGEVVDLGLIDAYYDNPAKALYWRLVGKPLADRRIKRANENLS